jgi:hypothetical protein
MDAIPFVVAAKLLGIGTASGARAGGAMLLIAILGRAGALQVPGSLSWLTSTPAIGSLAAATVIEELLERDDDAQELMATVKYGIHGTGALVLSWVVLEQFRLPWDGWPIAVLGSILALFTHNLRMRLHEGLRGLEAGLVSPQSWLSWLEAGGAAGLAAAAVLAPALALVLVVVGVFATAGTGVLLRRLEDRHRRACPTCGTAVRKEARLCPHCKEQLPVVSRVGVSLLSRVEQASLRMQHR